MQNEPPYEPLTRYAEAALRRSEEGAGREEDSRFQQWLRLQPWECRCLVISEEGNLAADDDDLLRRTARIVTRLIGDVSQTTVPFYLKYIQLDVDRYELSTPRKYRVTPLIFRYRDEAFFRLMPNALLRETLARIRSELERTPGLRVETRFPWIEMPLDPSIPLPLPYGGTPFKVPVAEMGLVRHANNKAGYIFSFHENHKCTIQDDKYNMLYKLYCMTLCVRLFNRKFISFSTNANKNRLLIPVGALNCNSITN